MGRRRFVPVDKARANSKTGKAYLAGRPDKKSPASVAPPALAEGQVRCPVCRNGTLVTPRGYLRTHSDLFGHTCSNRAAGEVEVVEVPPVTLDGCKGGPGVRRGVCRGCGRALPGERYLCGRCSVRQERAS